MGRECIYTHSCEHVHIHLFLCVVVVPSESKCFRLISFPTLDWDSWCGSATFQLYDLNESWNQFIVYNLTHKIRVISLL